MIIASVIFVAGVLIAYVNGANDVSKGIATLVGGGITSYRRAVSWGTLWTGIGSITGAILAHAMVQTFGKGLLGPGTQPTLAAAVATIAGAAMWVALATRKGLPVSTTHAIVGSVAGVALFACGVTGVNWSAFGGKIALPLLLSPLVSFVLTFAVLRSWRVLAPARVADCICVEVSQPTPALASGGDMAIPALGMPKLRVARCVAHEGTTGLTLNHLHWLTSGATSFARGLNDAPKMVALLLAAAALSGRGSDALFIYFVAVTAGMLAGSWVAGGRVTEVLACKITPMNHREGFVANLVTAALVGPGAALGLPMSTTHVSSGAIIGIAVGRNNAAANRQILRDISLAWLVTAPAAALLGVVFFSLLRSVGVH